MNHVRARFLAATIGFFVACPLLADAQELAARDRGNPRAWQAYTQRTEQLEIELASLRDRLAELEMQPTGQDYVDSDVYVDSDLVHPGWTGYVDYLNWTLRRRDLDFAIPTDGSSLAIGIGAVRELGFDRDSGVRAGISYLTKTGWDIGFTYTFFHTSARDTAAEPVGGAMWATRSHANRNEEALTAEALGSFDYHVFDLEAGHALWMNRFTTVKLLGGLRWATIDQDLLVNYDGRDFSNGVVSQPVSMDAFGIRLGIEGRWHLPCGWSLFGRGAGSVMYGSFRSRSLETNRAGVDTIVDVQDNYEQAVPVFEAAVGVCWTHELVQVAAGYEATSWWNLGDRSSFVDGVHEGLYVPQSTDILLDGLFLRLTVLF